MKAFLPFLALSLSLSTPALLAEETETMAVSGLTFEYGEPWLRQQPSSSMRAGQLLYEHEDEALGDVEMAIFYFGGTGGSVRANLDRWLGQFEPAPESKEETKKIDGNEIVILEAKGTYMESSGGPFSGNKTPREGYAMLAAIVPGPEGNVFLKATGPEAAVMAMKDAFVAFAESPFGE